MVPVAVTQQGHTFSRNRPQFTDCGLQFTLNLLNLHNIAHYNYFMKIKLKF